MKGERVRAALEDAPKIGDSLCDACREHFDAVQAHLDEYGVEYTLAPTLVRGLDYYTRTTFEFIDEAIGAQSSICGGGRYDGLIEEIGGKPTPGIGFGAGHRAAAAVARAAPAPSPSPTRSTSSSRSTMQAANHACSRSTASCGATACAPTSTTQGARSRAS